MNEQRILSSLNRSIQQAPIDILDHLKTTKVVSQLEHDAITQQAQVEVQNSTRARKNPFSQANLRYFSAAAVFMLITATLLIQFQMRTLQTIVYLDVNPSVAITLNSRDKIIALDAKNDDGEEILKDISLQGKSVEYLTLEIIHRLHTQGYLKTNEDVLLVSVYSKDKERATTQVEKMDALLKDALARTQTNPILVLQTIQTSGTLEDLAKTYAVSQSRLHFIGLLMRFNPNLTLEDLVNQSLQDLLAIADQQQFDLNAIITPEVVDAMVESTSQLQAATTLQTLIPPTAPPQTTQAPQTTAPKQTGQLISLERAIAIALNYVQGQVIEARLDSFDDDDDDGDGDGPEYHIVISTQLSLYRLEIDARTGDIAEISIHNDDDLDDDDDQKDDLDDQDDDDDDDDDQDDLDDSDKEVDDDDDN